MADLSEKTVLAKKHLVHVRGMKLTLFTLHKKYSFPLKTSQVNVTESTVSCGFGHMYWRNPLMENFIFCAVSMIPIALYIRLFRYKTPGLLFIDFEVSESACTGEITK